MQQVVTLLMILLLEAVIKLDLFLLDLSVMARCLRVHVRCFAPISKSLVAFGPFEKEEIFFFVATVGG